MESTEREQQRASRRRLRAVLLATIGLLYLFSVPWYRSSDAELVLWLGLPDWVAVAIVCYGLAAILNSWAWLLTPIDDDGPLPDTLGDAQDGRPGSEP